MPLEQKEGGKVKEDRIYVFVEIGKENWNTQEWPIPPHLGTDKVRRE